MTMRFHLITNSKSSKQYPITVEILKNIVNYIDEKYNNQRVLEFLMAYLD